MVRLFLAALAGPGVICAALDAAAAEPRAAAEPPTAAKAEALMTAYRTNVQIEARLKAIGDLEKIRGPAVENFLIVEYGKLDGTKPVEARLSGAFLRVWAARLDQTALPYLIYEGLFHDDAEVVCACAAGIARMPEQAKALMSTGRAAAGRDPGEELAEDLIHRMNERAEWLPPLETVLSLWSGKTRPGFQPTLKRKPDEPERAAAREFWQGWFEGRFKRKLKPAK